MSIFLIILTIVIGVPVGLLIWTAIGAKRAMNRNDRGRK